MNHKCSQLRLGAFFLQQKAWQASLIYLPHVIPYNMKTSAYGATSPPENRSSLMNVSKDDEYFENAFIMWLLSISLSDVDNVAISANTDANVAIKKSPLQ